MINKDATWLFGVPTPYIVLIWFYSLGVMPLQARAGLTLRTVAPLSLSAATSNADTDALRPLELRIHPETQIFTQSTYIGRILRACRWGGAAPSTATTSAGVRSALATDRNVRQCPPVCRAFP